MKKKAARPIKTTRKGVADKKKSKYAFRHSGKPWLVAGVVVAVLLVAGLVAATVRPGSQQQEPMLEMSDRPDLNDPDRPPRQNDDIVDGQPGPARAGGSSPRLDSNERRPAAPTDSDDRPVSSGERETPQLRPGQTPPSEQPDTVPAPPAQPPESQPCEPRNVGETIGQFVGRMMGASEENC